MRILGTKVLGVMALGLVFCLPGVAWGSLLYSQDFDEVGQAALVSPGAGNTAAIGTVLPGWSATANNANRADVIIANGTVGGNGVGAYLATGDGIDFNLSVYNNGAGSNNYITYTYTATSTVTDLVGSFDFESAWSRYDSSRARTGGFEVPLTYALNGGTPVTVSGVPGFHVSNATITNASDITIWLTDARMDALGLSNRTVSFSLSGVTLNPGDTITFKWAQSTTAGDRNMAAGIDNFMLGDNNSLAPVSTDSALPVPIPASAMLLGSGLFGLGLLAWRRKNS